jgi:hypothetical protein
MDLNEVLARAQAQDLNRQRQVEAAKAVTNRLLEARESETPDKELILELVQERSGLQQHILELQARIDYAVEFAEAAEANGDASAIVLEMARLLKKTD